MDKKHLVLIALLAGLASFIQAAPFGTAFTYQGRPADAGQPANGLFEFEFGLWTAPATGVLLEARVKPAIEVTNGLFTVELEFDPRFINGEERWLEIKAHRSGVANYTTLTPRQRLAPTPHALHARNAGLALTVPDGSITSAKLAAGAVTAVNIVPGVFYVTAGTNQTLRFVSPFAQQFNLNWIAVEP